MVWYIFLIRQPICFVYYCMPPRPWYVRPRAGGSHYPYRKRDTWLVQFFHQVMKNIRRWRVELVADNFFLPYFLTNSLFVAIYPCSSPPEIRHDLMKYSMNGKQWKNINLQYGDNPVSFFFSVLFSKCSSVWGRLMFGVSPVGSMIYILCDIELLDPPPPPPGSGSVSNRISCTFLYILW